MVTLTLPASEIPNNTSVRKVTGKKIYKLWREIKIYGENRQEVKPDEDLIFIVAENDGGITCIKDSTLLSVNFECYSAVISFLRQLDNAATVKREEQWEA